jgi:predicted negative regulator of RcsB-dependent stress response
LLRYKDCMVVSWLASTVWSHQTGTGPASDNLNRMLSETYKTGMKLPITQTVLEGIYGIRAFEVPLPNDPKAGLLTHWSRGWLSFIFEEHDFENAVEDMMGILLYQQEYDLAKDFSKFLTEGHWASYLKGRLYLALGNKELASVSFQKPAYYLGKSTTAEFAWKTLTSAALSPMFDVAEEDKAALISEVERNQFSEGLAHYYSHVIGLFEKAKAYSYVADFAKLGLRSLMGQEDEELKTDLLQRLFTASIQTSRFHDAYSALIRHRDTAL